MARPSGHSWRSMAARKPSTAVTSGASSTPRCRGRYGGCVVDGGHGCPLSGSPAIMKFGKRHTGVLRRVRLGGPTLERVEWIETVARDCRLDVTNGPDGTLYLSDLARIFRLAR